MYTFEQKPKLIHGTSSGEFSNVVPRNHEENLALRPKPLLRETKAYQEGEPVLETNSESHDLNKTGTGARSFGHNFSMMAVSSRWQNKSRSAYDGSAETRSIIRNQRQPFLATLRRVSPAFQNDAAGGNKEKPAIDAVAPATRPRAVALGDSIPDLTEGGPVLFPASDLPSIALTDQDDAIASNFAYTNSITQKDPPPDPGQFGTTRPVYEFEKPGVTVTPSQGAFRVEGVITARITFQVTSLNRTNIASDSDASITQANYPTVVSDLTPSPQTVTMAGETTYKNQPPRTRYWSEELTIKHERVHADENVKFGAEGVTIAQAWLNSQTAKTIDEVGALLPGVNPRVARKVDTEMALPGRELRAYEKGAPGYVSLAQAIKTKGQANGYVPKPPAPNPQNPPPPAKPKVDD